MQLAFPGIEVPLVGIVSRLAWQKGLDLVAEAAPQLANLGAMLVVLGTGDTAQIRKLSTVSEAYSREIATPEYGLGKEGIIIRRQADLVGILNGVRESAATTSASPPVLEKGSASEATIRIFIAQRPEKEQCSA